MPTSRKRSRAAALAEAKEKGFSVLLSDYRTCWLVKCVFHMDRDSCRVYCPVCRMPSGA